MGEEQAKTLVEFVETKLDDDWEKKKKEVASKELAETVGDTANMKLTSF